MRKFRFGVSLRFGGAAQAWVAKCQRAQQLGFDTITVPDHLGGGRPAPFPALTSAADVTEGIRVGTLVLNAPFYNPALLARDVETLSGLTGGAFDLGIGAGHMKSEFDDAGLPWWPARERVDYLEHTIAELTRRLGSQLPPLLIAGNSDAVLDVAAKHADIVGFSGLLHAPGHTPGTFHLETAEGLDERVGHFAAQAGARSHRVERNMLIQHAEVADNPAEAIQRWGADAPELNLDGDELLAAPQFLIGSTEELIDRVQGLRERYGFTYITVFEQCMEAFAPVVAALSGR